MTAPRIQLQTNFPMCTRYCTLSQYHLAPFQTVLDELICALQYALDSNNVGLWTCRIVQRAAGVDSIAVSLFVDFCIG